LNWKFATRMLPSFNLTISFRQALFRAELIFRM
jgi:hypothetical protein